MRCAESLPKTPNLYVRGMVYVETKISLAGEGAAHLRVGDAVHDDDGADVGLTGGPFLQVDAGEPRLVVARETAVSRAATR